MSNLIKTDFLLIYYCIYYNKEAECSISWVSDEIRNYYSNIIDQMNNHVQKMTVKELATNKELLQSLWLDSDYADTDEAVTYMARLLSAFAVSHNQTHIPRLKETDELIIIQLQNK